MISFFNFFLFFIWITPIRNTWRGPKIGRLGVSDRSRKRIIRVRRRVVWCITRFGRMSRFGCRLKTHWNLMTSSKWACSDDTIGLRLMTDLVTLTCLRSLKSIGCLVPEILPIEFWKFMTSSKVGQAWWGRQHCSRDKLWHSEHMCKVWLQTAPQFGKYTCVGYLLDNRPIPIGNALAVHLGN